MTTATAFPPDRLIVRKLEVDLKRGFARHWHGGRAFRSQFFNALSMSFPVGEQFFIDSVRDAAALLPPGPVQEAMRETVAGFIGQEATHRHIHGLYNAQLEAQGLINRWQHWAADRLARFRKLNPNPRHARWLEGADADMQTVWRWHAAEETEHNAVAFDLYRAVGGSYKHRVLWYLYVVLRFCIDSAAQTAINLWHDGTLFKPGTWVDGARLFWGRDGLVWRCAGPMLQYLRRDFHPSQDPHAVPAQTLAAQWLAAHANRWRAVR